MALFNISNEELQKLLATSDSYSDVLRKLGANVSSGGNYRTLASKIKKYGLCDDRIKNNKPIQNYVKKINSEIFRENSEYFRRGRMKKILIDEFNFTYNCSECGVGDMYNNKPITLQLDHINGVNNDHRIENLRFLCPNCHSQTENYAGKKNKKYELRVNRCECSKIISPSAKRCPNCVERKKKITWPSIENLTNMLWEKPTSSIAKELGVSDTAIKKFCRKHNINKPPRGYWAKQSPPLDRSGITQLAG